MFLHLRTTYFLSRHTLHSSHFNPQWLEVWLKPRFNALQAIVASSRDEEVPAAGIIINKALFNIYVQLIIRAFTVIALSHQGKMQLLKAVKRKSKYPSTVSALIPPLLSLQHEFVSPKLKANLTKFIHRLWSGRTILIIKWRLTSVPSLFITSVIKTST